jgi:DNA-binding beta-propeller fold protein YncE
MSVARVGDLLYVRNDYGVGGLPHVEVVDAAAGKSIRQLPIGVPAPDWSAIYTAQASGGKTTLRAIDPTTASVTGQTTVDGVYDVAGTSPNGTWLVLQWQPSQAEAKAFDGNGRWQSRYVVIDRTLVGSSKAIALDGKFSFDAIDNRGTSLFLIEYQSPGVSSGPLPYQVRLYDLATRALEPGAIVDKTNTEVMSGDRHAAVFSPDGNWVYTLYRNDVSGPFIHALNLSEHFAVCVDLPTTGKGDFEKQLLWSLAMTKDGQTLYAANGALGVVATVDLKSLSVAHTAQLPLAQAAVARDPLAQLRDLLAPTAEAKRVLLGGAALTPDGRILFAIAEKGVLAIDTADLKLRGRYQSDWALDSLALSPDGARLYVVDAERAAVVALNPSSGEMLSTVRGASHPWAVLRVQSIGESAKAG